MRQFTDEEGAQCPYLQSMGVQGTHEELAIHVTTQRSRSGYDHRLYSDKV